MAPSAWESRCPFRYGILVRRLARKRVILSEEPMHKAIVGAAAGLALLVNALSTLDANAATLTRTPLASPLQTVACWCGVLGGSTAALTGGRSYRCSCNRARALRAPPRMPCSAHQSQFYCETNNCHWQSMRMICS